MSQAPPATSSPNIVHQQLIHGTIPFALRKMGDREEHMGERERGRGGGAEGRRSGGERAGERERGRGEV